MTTISEIPNSYPVSRADKEALAFLCPDHDETLDAGEIEMASTLKTIFSLGVAAAPESDREMVVAAVLLTAFDLGYQWRHIVERRENAGISHGSPDSPPNTGRSAAGR